jgi:hypothetical protein
LKISDLVLNNSSSAGLEAALFGIPVLGIGDDLYSFDHNLQIEAESLESYEAYILSLSAESWSIGRVIKAYRWLNYLNSEVAIDISDGYKSMKFNGPRVINFFRRMVNNILIKIKLANLFPEVKNRSKPLKNIDRLIYAIINNVDSHIGQFEHQVLGDPYAERLAIERNYLSIMKSISAKNDEEFLLRAKSCALNF